MSDLKPGKYRMTVEVEIDEDGYLLPHDSGEMFMASWWVENDATFEPVPPPQCAECGWWLTTSPASCPSCGTPTGLGVSGEDRSEPTPAPRPGDRVRLFTPDDIITGVLYVGQDGKRRVLEHDRWGHLVDVPGRHVEVVSPEGTS